MRSYFYFGQMENHTVSKMPFAKVYPMYVPKAERKTGRTEKEVIEIISLVDRLGRSSFTKSI
jgi:hypothetical protein